MKVCLDFGHGGKDSGAIGHGLKEKDIVLDVGLRTQRLLVGIGIDVLLTRCNDTFVELSDRAKMANKWGADLFVSLHVNSGGGYGFESFVYLKTDSKTDRYREAIHCEVAPLFRRDRGMKRANLAVCRETSMPACLLEFGFIDNATDAADLAKDVFRGKLALAIANGILKAFGMESIANDKGEEEMDRKLQLQDWQWKQLFDNMGKAWNAGKFTDWKWMVKIENHSLTIDELIWLNNHIMTNSL
ncbi:N-acetylmuramoyl-L-alanine amidase [Paenibacillus larvae]